MNTPDTDTPQPPAEAPAKGVGSTDLLGRLKPNEIVGVVMQTSDEYNVFYGRKRCMVVRWQDGSASEGIPMPIIANVGDRFVFTIRPAERPGMSHTAETLLYEHTNL